MQARGWARPLLASETAATFLPCWGEQGWQILARSASVLLVKTSSPQCGLSRQGLAEEKDWRSGFLRGNSPPAAAPVSLGFSVHIIY